MAPSHILSVFVLLTLFGAALAATGSFNYSASGADWTGACADGKRQSPINIVRGNAEDAGSSSTFSLNYQSINEFSLVNNGVVIQVNPVKANESKLVLRDGSVYSLLQLHFHGFSEHAIDGQLGPLEVHFVHRSDDDPMKLAVVGVLFHLDPNEQNNAILDSIVDSIPQTVSAVNLTMTVDFASFLNVKSKSQRVYTYLGSLTTPRCDEIVEWFVLAKHQYVSVAQLYKFYDAISAVAHGDWTDNRPQQPLNGRVVSTFVTAQ